MIKEFWFLILKLNIEKYKLFGSNLTQFIESMEADDKENKTVNLFHG